MFGRLVTSSPSRCGRREPVGERRQTARTRIRHGRQAFVSARAARARSRMLPVPRRRRPPRAQASNVVAPARARTHSSHAPRRRERAIADKRVADREARVRVGARVDHDAVDLRHAARESRRSTRLRRCAARTVTRRRSRSRRRATTARCRQASRGHTARVHACQEDSDSGR